MKESVMTIGDRNMGNTRSICFCNNKGGSGKTTTCGNLGYCLSKLGKKVLMIDGDMQLNLSLSYLDEEKVLDYSQGENNLFTCIHESKDLSECIVKTPFDGLDLIPSSMRMSTMESVLCKEKAGEFFLNDRLQKIKDKGLYDYILIDSPPTLGTWVKNLVCASDQMIIPVEASPWGLFGLANMLEFLEQAKLKANNLELMGVLITKVDDRKKYYKSVLDALEEFGNVPVFETKIHIDSTVEWAQDESRPVCEFKGSSKSAKEYMEFAKEVDALWQ